MKKLTAEKCRSHIARLKRYERESLYQFPFEIEMLEAFEIALPVLEQQEAKKKLSLREGVEAIRKSTAESGGYNFDALRAEQESDGWIEWRGNSQPVNPSVIVKVRWADGDIDSGPCRHFFWGKNCGNPVVAYRVVEQEREREEEE